MFRRLSPDQASKAGFQAAKTELSMSIQNRGHSNDASDLAHKKTRLYGAEIHARTTEDPTNAVRISETR